MTFNNITDGVKTDVWAKKFKKLNSSMKSLAEVSNLGKMRKLIKETVKQIFTCSNYLIYHRHTVFSVS